MVLCATVALCCVVRYVESGRMIWLSAGGGMMGVAIITKETSVILLGGLYRQTEQTRTVYQEVDVADDVAVIVDLVDQLFLDVDDE